MFGSSCHAPTAPVRGGRLPQSYRQVGAISRCISVPVRPWTSWSLPDVLIVPQSASMTTRKHPWMVEDRLWALLAPLIPPPGVARGPGGRPRIEDRAALEGILFVLYTGCRWRDLPLALGCGSGHTAWRRLRQWQAAGVWEKLHTAVLEELSVAGILDWSRASIDSVSVRAKRGAN